MSDITYEAKMIYLPIQNRPLLNCYCHYCVNEHARTLDELGIEDHRSGFMILCPECGCKRCPSATYHGHNCTRSNDPGQQLSVYGDFKIDTSWMGLCDDDCPDECTGEHKDGA